MKQPATDAFKQRPSQSAPGRYEIIILDSILIWPNQRPFEQ